MRSIHWTQLGIFALTLVLAANLAVAAQEERRLKGTYGTVGATFLCIETPPGGIDPETFELLVDANRTSAWSRIGFEFDGRGNVSFVGSRVMIFTTTALAAGDQPVQTPFGPDLPLFAEGTYQVESDGSLSFEYEIFGDLGGGLLLTSTPLRVEGFVGSSGKTIVLGIAEPQVRTLFVGDTPIVEQLCGWSGTAVKLPNSRGDDDDEDEDDEEDEEDDD